MKMRNLSRPHKSSVLTVGAARLNTRQTYMRNQRQQRLVMKQSGQSTSLSDQVWQWSIEELTLVEAAIIEIYKIGRLCWTKKWRWLPALWHCCQTRIHPELVFSLPLMTHSSILCPEMMDWQYLEIKIFDSGLFKKITLVLKGLGLADQSESWFMY